MVFTCLHSFSSLKNHSDCFIFENIFMSYLANGTSFLIVNYLAVFSGGVIHCSLRFGAGKTFGPSSFLGVTRSSC
jgi:hypothetical protein